MLPALSVIRKHTLNIKQTLPPLPPESKESPQENSSLTLFAGSLENHLSSSTVLRGTSKWKRAPWSGLLPYSQGHKHLSRTPRPKAQRLGTCLAPHSLLSQLVTHLFMDLGTSGWHQEQLMKSHASENQPPKMTEEEEAGPGSGSRDKKKNQGSKYFKILKENE